MMNITDHAIERYKERVKDVQDIDVHIINEVRNGFKLTPMPLSNINMRFYTRYPHCSYFKVTLNPALSYVAVVNEDDNTIITVLNWNQKMKECFYY